jgi:hypothetical protein
MDTITLTHQGHTVALAAAHRLWFAAHIEALPDGHPRKRLVVFMALYAREILTGKIPGPYRDEDAECFARLALIDADVIKRHPRASTAQLAQLLGIPHDQLTTFLHDNVDATVRRPRPCRIRRRRRPPQPAR